jgi:hypothetical protein
LIFSIDRFSFSDGFIGDDFVAFSIVNISVSEILKNIKMKNLIKITGFALLLTAGLGACKKDYVEPQFTQEEQSKSPRVNENKIAGVWVITTFEWKNRVPNENFRDYTFRFESDGVVYASKGDVAEKGLWTRTRESLLLDFGSLQPLYELNNKWMISEWRDNYFIMKSFSRIDGSSQYIIFKRLK